MSVAFGARGLGFAAEDNDLPRLLTVAISVGLTMAVRPSLPLMLAAFLVCLVLTLLQAILLVCGLPIAFAVLVAVVVLPVVSIEAALAVLFEPSVATAFGLPRSFSILAVLALLALLGVATPRYLRSVGASFSTLYEGVHSLARRCSVRRSATWLQARVAAARFEAWLLASNRDL
jgi:hypothetical protein